MLRFTIAADSIHATTLFLQHVTGLGEKLPLDGMIPVEFGSTNDPTSSVRSIILVERSQDEALTSIVEAGGMAVSSDETNRCWIVTSWTGAGKVIGVMIVA